MSWLGYEVRADERRLVTSAALVAMAIGAGLALVTSAGDALFLARVGVRHLGTMFALSSATLIIVLGYVGAIADRRDRGRLLVVLAGLAALVVAALAASLSAAPELVAGATLVLGKQVGAALDLAFWVLVAERFDARQARRLLPLLVAAQGIGVALGSFGVDWMVHDLGARAVLLAGAGMFVVAMVAALGFAGREVPRPLPARTPLRRPPVWTAGWRAVRQSPLATRLAVLVAVAGVFAPILYYLLGAAAAQSYGNEADIAGFLGRYRGLVQLLTLAAAFVAPAILARTGVAPALLIAPLGAVVAAAALVASYELVVVAVAQASARMLDTAVQTPAEKLVQNLLPRQMRGRVQGFLDGVAKRAGAIAGGLAASALVVWGSVLAVTTVVAALLWLVVAWRLRRRFAELAVAELAARGGSAREDGDDTLVTLVDERSVRRLRSDLVGDRERRTLAIELVGQLGERGRLDAAVELVVAARSCSGEARLQLLVAVDALACAVIRRADGGVFCAELEAITADDGSSVRQRRLALRALGRAAPGLSEPRARDSARAVIAALIDDPQVTLAAVVARARMAGGDAVDEVFADELAGGERSEALVDELAAELAWLACAPEVDPSRLADRARAVLRVLRRSVTDELTCAGLAGLTVAVDRFSSDRTVSAELVLLRAEVRELAERLAEAGQVGAEWRRPVAPAVRARALALLAALADPSSANLLARALGDSDDEVRRIAGLGLRALGGEAIEVLLVAASFGRRGARNTALELLRDLRVTGAALDHLIENELIEIDETSARTAALAELEEGGLLVERLEERIDEAAHTLFLVLEARLADRAIGAAADRFLRAREPAARARALEALDAVLPRSLALRVLARLEQAPAKARALRAAARLDREPLDLDQATRAELGGGDPLGRALVVAALGSSGRANHRDAIAAAAEAASHSLDPLSMLRRIAASGDEEGERDSLEDDEMPRSVETMMALSQLPIFAELTTRQLAELADVVRWQAVAAGKVIVAQGDAGDATYFILTGRVAVAVASDGGVEPLGELGPGELFGEMALFEDDPRSATVTALERTQLGRIERADFEELVEDVPGIALAICRVLSRRVREQNQRRPPAT